MLSPSRKRKRLHRTPINQSIIQCRSNAIHDEPNLMRFVSAQCQKAQIKKSENNAKNSPVVA
jgi:hypothetical protein